MFVHCNVLNSLRDFLVNAIVAEQKQQQEQQQQQQNLDTIYD